MPNDPQAPRGPHHPNMEAEMNERGESTVALLVLAVVAVIALAFVAMWGCPQYSIYHQKLTGEAELARSRYAKQIAVQEANAKMESSALLAQADTIRAHGQARANAILAHSLSGPDGQAYLRYLWIQGLGENGRTPTVIYVPTEAGLPIIEAGRKAGQP